jgi:NADPH-dependent 2,4-dienoyl-CoA reductase/sulfur reductase-like enzyme
MGTDAHAEILVVGGSDAGIMAGLRAAEVHPGSSPLLLVADEYPNFSICGIPFYLSGETPDWRSLAHRTRDDLWRAGLRLETSTTARQIDPGAGTVRAERADGTEIAIAYEHLVVATGARPARPPIPGIDLPGVHLLHTIDDARSVAAAIADATGHGPARAVIVGAGYIGVEMADSLRVRGMEVELIEMADSVLTTLDPDLGGLVGDVLAAHGTAVRAGTRVQAIERHGDELRVLTDPGPSAEGHLVIVAVGVAPNVDMAHAAGVALGANGAIAVDRRMRTNVEGIHAAGDCVATHHVLLAKPTYLPLGTTAHKQGRVAGENAAGGDAEVRGSLGTQVVKVHDLVAGRTGLRTDEARAASYDVREATVVVDDHKAYYPGATPMHVRITGDARGRLLGAQIVGAIGAQVAKRIDAVAVAIHSGMDVADLATLDLSYTPPLSSPDDPVQAGALAWQRGAELARLGGAAAPSAG